MSQWRGLNPGALGNVEYFFIDISPTLIWSVANRLGPIEPFNHLNECLQMIDIQLNYKYLIVILKQFNSVQIELLLLKLFRTVQRNELYLVYNFYLQCIYLKNHMYKQDLTLDNNQGLVCN